MFARAVGSLILRHEGGLDEQWRYTGQALHTFELEAPIESESLQPSVAMGRVLRIRSAIG